MRGEARTPGLARGLAGGDGANATRRRGVAPAAFAPGDAAPTPLARLAPRSAPLPRGAAATRRRCSTAPSAAASAMPQAGASSSQPSVAWSSMRDSVTAAEAKPPAIAARIAATDAVLSSESICKGKREFVVTRLCFERMISGKEGAPTRPPAP